MLVFKLVPRDFWASGEVCMAGFWAFDFAVHPSITPLTCKISSEQNYQQGFESRLQDMAQKQYLQFIQDDCSFFAQPH